MNFAEINYCLLFLKNFEEEKITLQGRSHNYLKWLKNTFKPI